MERNPVQYAAITTYWPPEFPVPKCQLTIDYEGKKKCKELPRVKEGGGLFGIGGKRVPAAQSLQFNKNTPVAQCIFFYYSKRKEKSAECTAFSG
jgi:hypothetical protein